MNRFAWVFLFLLLNVAGGQELTPLTTTNTTATNTANKPPVKSQLQDLREDFRNNEDTHNFWPVTLKDCIDVIQGLFVIAVSFFAIRGINSWRKEFSGKRRIELAEEVLVLFYQARDIIASERCPFYFAGEYSARKVESNDTPKQKQIHDLAHVTFERSHKHNEIFSRIYALRYRVMAQFDKDSIAPFNELKSVLDDIRTALDQWVMLSEVDSDLGDWQTPQLFQQHQAKIEECRKILWGMGKDDLISPRLEKIIESIEQICRSQITGKE